MGKPCKGDLDRLTDSCGHLAVSFPVFRFHLPPPFPRLVSYVDILASGEVRHAR
jgi:hypothetical protein